MAGALREKRVEGLRLNLLACGAALDEETQHFAELSSCRQERAGFQVRRRGCGKAELFQPGKNIVVGLKRVARLAFDERNGIQQVQDWLVGQGKKNAHA